MARKYYESHQPNLKITGVTAKPNGKLSEVRGLIRYNGVNIPMRFQKCHPIELAWERLGASV